MTPTQQQTASDQLNNILHLQGPAHGQAPAHHPPARHSPLAAHLRDQVAGLVRARS